MATSNDSGGGGFDSLRLLKSAEPPLYLSPSENLSQAARAASDYIYSSLKPYTPKAPFERLLMGGFDAEQIWQQIDLQSQPLLSSLRRELKRFENNPEGISKLFGVDERKEGEEREDEEEVEMEGEGFEELDNEDFGEEEGEEESEEGEEEREDDGEENGVEDKFFKIKELEEYLEEDEAREYGTKKDKKKGGGKLSIKNEDGEEEEDEDEDEDEEDDELGLIYGADLGDEDEGARYMHEDFFGPKKKNDQKREPKKTDESDDLGPDAEQDDDKTSGNQKQNLSAYEEQLVKVRSKIEQMEKANLESKTWTMQGELGLIYGVDLGDEDEGARYMHEDFFGPKKKNDQKREPNKTDESDDLVSDAEQDDDKTSGNQKQNLSAYEEQLVKVRSKIEQMEKANLEPKTWTMQGEVTAAKRPMNSALEVDLDFEHNVRPAPVITEEFTASIEELIQKRILEGHFDDVQKAPNLPSKAPKERKELDENKSKMGLAEIYEEEYVQKTGLVSTALSFSDEQKKEASLLFKKLCLKLDALSHFHFTPKPVIEEMSIQTNVPALAMEEIAPLAVSDAAMLAPEEVFAGKGDIKEETELTQAERKRRRADKKRKFKVESVKKTAMKKARESAVPNHVAGKVES